MRACGACTLCCKLLAVDELGKPPVTWCAHARKGTGCAIYETRPATCRAFVCAWQQGVGLEAQRPDRVHAVVSGQITDGHLGIFEDPGYPGEARTALAPLIAATCEAGKVVVLVRGPRRLVIATPEALTQVALESSATGA